MRGGGVTPTPTPIHVVYDSEGDAHTVTDIVESTQGLLLGGNALGFRTTGNLVIPIQCDNSEIRSYFKLLKQTEGPEQRAWDEWASGQEPSLTVKVSNETTGEEQDEHAVSNCQVMFDMGVETSVFVYDPDL